MIHARNASASKALQARFPRSPVLAACDFVVSGDTCAMGWEYVTCPYCLEARDAEARRIVEADAIALDWSDARPARLGDRQVAAQGMERDLILEAVSAGADALPPEPEADWAPRARPTCPGCGDQVRRSGQVCGACR